MPKIYIYILLIAQDNLDVTHYSPLNREITHNQPELSIRHLINVFIILSYLEKNPSFASDGRWQNLFKAFVGLIYFNLQPYLIAYLPE